MATSMALDNLSNIYLLGRFESDTFKLNTIGVNDLVNQGYEDAFIIKVQKSMPAFTPSATNITSTPFNVNFQIIASIAQIFVGSGILEMVHSRQQ